jgi:hypothetical protein
MSEQIEQAIEKAAQVVVEAVTHRPPEDYVCRILDAVRVAENIVYARILERARERLVNESGMSAVEIRLALEHIYDRTSN